TAPVAPDPESGRPPASSASEPEVGDWLSDTDETAPTRDDTEITISQPVPTPDGRSGSSDLVDWLSAGDDTLEPAPVPMAEPATEARGDEEDEDFDGLCRPAPTLGPATDHPTDQDP